MVTSVAGFQNDQPETGSIRIRVYRPIGIGSTVAAAPGTLGTKMVMASYDAATLVAEQGQFASASAAGIVGPPQAFVGPLQPVWTTQTTYVPGQPFTVTRGIYADPISIDSFLSYELYEHYTIPCDALSFSLSADGISADQQAALVPGAKVETTIDDCVQTTGYIDKVRVRSARGSGTLVTVTVRHWIAPAVDGHVDPQTRFVPSMTLLDLLNTIFAQFGMTAVSSDNVANRNAITGSTFGAPTSKSGRTAKNFVLHQEKPYPNEGAFAFASRISQRFGLWIRPGATFGTIVVAQPDFDQDPRYTILHKTDGQSVNNNVLDADVAWDREQQPSIIFGAGVGAGGDFAKSTLRAYIVNPLVASSPTALQALISKYSGIVQTPIDAVALPSGLGNIPIPDPTSRPLYLYDSESHTQAQLQAYLTRELALRMKKALTAKYTILGHRLGGQNVAVDTIANVDDDRSPLQAQMWILSRRFSKTVHGGTTSEIETILPGTLVFGPGGSA